MKRNFFVSLIVVAFPCCASAQVPVRIAVYNIENLNTTTGAQIEAAVDVLNRVCADVVCVQEMRSTAAFTALADQAGYPFRVIATTSNAIDGVLRTGVMSRDWPFTMTMTETSITISGDGGSRDLTRNFMVAEIDVAGAAQDLVLIGNHWKSGGGNDDEFRRSLESTRAMQISSAYDSTVVPYLVLGDMNDEFGINSPALFTSLPAGLPISFQIGNDMAAMLPVPGFVNSVFSPLEAGVGAQNITVVDAFQLFPVGDAATRPASGRRLDYIWTSDAAVVVASEVYDSADEGIGGGIALCGGPLPSVTSLTASDHLPVVVDIVMLSGAPAPDVSINEIRIDQPGGDVDEYVELAAAPGTSLAGVTYLVLGDGAGGSGVIEELVSLNGQTVGASGFFTIATGGFTLGSADLTTTLNFEDADNVTHMLVYQFTGSVGDDLDTNDDGVLDFALGTELIDSIAVIREDNPPTFTEFHYGPPQVGPSAILTAPMHVFRCPDETGVWRIGQDDPVGGSDTPGAANACAVVSGACCDALTGVCNFPIDSIDCVGPQLTFTAGVDCVDLVPLCSADPDGACCLPGSCSETSEFFCDAVGGIYQGDATVCNGTCPDTTINEIRITQPGAENDEYFELSGPPGSSLFGLTYLVIGDAFDGGRIEAIIDLSDAVIPADGYLLAAEDGDTFGAVADALVALNFEDGDNVTHLLVTGFSGVNNQDLDTNDDGVLDVTPWLVMLDCLAVLDEIGGGDPTYCADTVGPNGGIGPQHVFRCQNDNGAWLIGADDPVGGADTPGNANVCVVGACCSAGACVANVSDPFCTSLGGVYQGDASDCGLVNCELPGACCRPDASCDEVVASLCNGTADVFTPGGSCDPNPCSVIPTVSEWGVMLMVLLLLVGGTIVFGVRGGSFGRVRLE